MPSEAEIAALSECRPRLVHRPSIRPQNPLTREWRRRRETQPTAMRFTRSRDVKSAHNIRHFSMAHTLRNPTITTKDHSNGGAEMRLGTFVSSTSFQTRAWDSERGRWSPKLMPGHDPSDSPVTAVGATEPYRALTTPSRANYCAARSVPKPNLAKGARSLRPFAPFRALSAPLVSA